MALFDGYSQAVAVTPHDTNDLDPKPTSAVYVGGAGNLSMILENDTAPVLFTALPVGIHRLAVTRVRSTDTTATAIVALY